MPADSPTPDPVRTAPPSGSTSEGKVTETQEEEQDSENAAPPTFADNFTRLHIRIGLFLCLVIITVVFAWKLGLGLPEVGLANIFMYLVIYQDTPIIVMQMVVLGLSVWAFKHPWEWPAPSKYFERAQYTVPIMAAIALLVCLVGTYVVFLNYPLCMDEYMADVQSRMYLAGKIKVPVPEEWIPFTRSITPSFMTLLPVDNTWVGPYLPVCSILRAPFVAMNAQALFNPLLQAGTVLLGAAIARRLWPAPEQANEAAVVAAVMLLFSVQAEVMAMTPYAMTSHLFFSLLWLYYFLQPGWPKWILAPLAGVLAMGLHQWVVHALFVTPFLVRLVLAGRWRMTAWYALIYLSSLALWHKWYLISRVAETKNPGKVLSFFDFPSIVSTIIMGMSQGRFIAWHMVGMFVLGMMGATVAWSVSYRRASRGDVADSNLSAKTGGVPASTYEILQDLTLGIFITTMLYLCFRLAQGHGWGYRYYHAIIGNFVLLAVAGWFVLRAHAPWKAVASWATVSLVSIAVIFPYFCFQAHGTTAPFAKAQAIIASQPSQVIVVPDDVIWYGRDLIRNDPLFREGPILVSRMMLSEEKEAELRKRPGVLFMDEWELAGVGLFFGPSVRYGKSKFQVREAGSE
ncbi:MAG: hypothetical protein ACAI35_21045 [Candidatus Methylacidiphilales bacterium]|nr:hypothetical protein [Candidatus Methylacidiphilales bacterium]